MLCGFRGINRHPTDSLRIKLRPAMVVGNFGFAALGRERKSNRKSRRYAYRTRIANKDGVEVSTVAASLLRDIINIAPARPFSALVVFDR